MSSKSRIIKFILRIEKIPPSFHGVTELQIRKEGIKTLAKVCEEIIKKTIVKPLNSSLF